MRIWDGVGFILCLRSWFPIWAWVRKMNQEAQAFLPVQSGLWHSLLSAQWPRHSDPPWAAAEHCLVLCWVPLAQVTEQSLQELHSCHCPSTEAPTTTQQARPKWRAKEGRHKQEEIFRFLFSLKLKASNTDINWRARCYMNTCLCWGDVLWSKS